MILSDKEENRLISILKLIDKRYKALPPDDEESICLSCISGAIEEYLERFVY